MEKIKSLADQLREELGKPAALKPLQAHAPPAPPVSHKAPIKSLPDLVWVMGSFDSSLHKSVVHVRFDKKTLAVMNQFKMATGIDISKFIAFSVDAFLESHPEVKTIIKQFIQNTEL
jgi:preprotein translocase subunit SecD